MDVEMQADDSPLYRDITIVTCGSNFVSGSYVDVNAKFLSHTADSCDQTIWTQAKDQGPTSCVPGWRSVW
jgi:hypothetical protein